MDERMRRQWAAAEARGLGYGGITRVSRASALDAVTWILCLAAGAAGACTLGYLYVRDEAGGAPLIDQRLLMLEWDSACVRGLHGGETPVSHEKTTSAFTQADERSTAE
jgi:hypothetical protein